MHPRQIHANYAFLSLDSAPIIVCVERGEITAAKDERDNSWWFALLRKFRLVDDPYEDVENNNGRRAGVI